MILVVTVLPAVVFAHNLGFREHHHLALTLSHDRLVMDYRIEFMGKPGGDPDKQAAEILRMVRLTIDNKSPAFKKIDAKQDGKNESFRFEAPLALTAGKHELSLLNLAPMKNAICLLTLEPGTDIRLPQAIEQVEIWGEINFTFGYKADPPKNQEIFIGRDITPSP